MVAPHLHKARKVKNDEFYTQMETINRELPYYKDYLADKIILCNCDSWRTSKFPLYLWQRIVKWNIKDIKVSEGDYESYPNINDVDVVITNPPFSKLKRFVSYLLDNDKKFLIIVPLTFCSSVTGLGLLSRHIVDVGYNWGPELYLGPDGSESNIATTWLTNLPVHKNLPFIKTGVKYDPELHPRYDNYDAINVSRMKDLPDDYEGKMGVPVTFMTKWNKDQFDIISDRYSFSVNGKMKFFRYIIQRKS